MTQIFIGKKPGGSSAIKILKNNGDDPLTIANDAYDRLFFNSEVPYVNQLVGSAVSEFRYTTATADGLYHMHGGAADAKVTYLMREITTQRQYTIAHRLDNYWPNRPFIPLVTSRPRFPTMTPPPLAQKYVTQQSGSGNIYRTYCFYGSSSCIQKVTSFFTPSGSGNILGTNWDGAWPVQFDTVLDAGDWVVRAGELITNGPNTVRSYVAINPGQTSYVFYNRVFVWNLPADSSPLPTYTGAPGLEAVRISPSRVAVARPGYDVSTASGPQQLILDSDLRPALCVLAGQVTVPASSTVVVANTSGVPLSENGACEAMVKHVGEDQYIPAYHPYFTQNVSDFGVFYEVVDGDLSFTNQSGYPLVITYLFFNTDPVQGPSSGGSQVMYRGNDGTQDFIQIKRPGSSDVAVRPDDILLDTRFPTLHILKEGWLPYASFSATGGAEVYTGRQRCDVAIDPIPAGLIPFVKYVTVFPDYIVEPACTFGLAETNTGNLNYGPSRQSSLCRMYLDGNVLMFYLNAGSWTYRDNTGYVGSSPDPLGIRYYLFGIPTP